jgi:hypothetical protein
MPAISSLFITLYRASIVTPFSWFFFPFSKKNSRVVSRPSHCSKLLITSSNFVQMVCRVRGHPVPAVLVRAGRGKLLMNFFRFFGAGTATFVLRSSGE